MSLRPKTRKLLVEGRDDKRVIPYLIEGNGIPWGETWDEPVVHIEDYDGVDDLLAKGQIETQSKSSGLEAIGIVLDADEDIADRWAKVRERCRDVCPDFPEDFAKDGIVHVSPRGLRIGVWMMPDNQARGMLETFLMYLAPTTDDPLLAYAKLTADEAKDRGATYKACHLDKARIHTWLAWQDPPGRQLHDAVKQRILQPDSPLAKPFVEWFKKLYRL